MKTPKESIIVQHQKRVAELESANNDLARTIENIQAHRVVPARKYDGVIEKIKELKEALEG